MPGSVPWPLGHRRWRPAWASWTCWTRRAASPRWAGAGCRVQLAVQSKQAGGRGGGVVLFKTGRHEGHSSVLCPWRLFAALWPQPRLLPPSHRAAPRRPPTRTLPTSCMPRPASRTRSAFPSPSCRAPTSPSTTTRVGGGAAGDQGRTCWGCLEAAQTRLARRGVRLQPHTCPLPHRSGSPPGHSPPQKPSPHPLAVPHGLLPPTAPPSPPCPQAPSPTRPTTSCPRTATLWWRSTRRCWAPRPSPLCAACSRPTRTAPAPARRCRPTASRRWGRASSASWATSWTRCTAWSRTTSAASSPTPSTAPWTLRT